MRNLQPTPILEDHLAEVAAFLHGNLNHRVAPTDWIASVQHHWCDWRPNFGVQLRDCGRLVGVLLAIYSEQEINGQKVRFCNPHSWCVLKEYRQQSIGLVLAVVKQKGLTFTMFTPNPRVAEVFRALGFKDLRPDIVAFPNFPFGPGAEVSARLAANPSAIMELLGPGPQRDFVLHRDIPWLRFIAVGVAGRACLVIYKRGRWKRLPSARILHVSDPVAFERHLGLVRRHLLFGEGLVTSQVEQRLVASPPTFSMPLESRQPRLWSSTTIAESTVSNLYSELMSLDI